MGSTSGIIDYADRSTDDAFIVATELGVMAELKRTNPEKRFYAVNNDQICPDMKKITLDRVIEVLENEQNEVILDAPMREAAHRPLERMLDLAK